MFAQRASEGDKWNNFTLARLVFPLSSSAPHGMMRFTIGHDLQRTDNGDVLVAVLRGQGMRDIGEANG